MDLLEAIYLLFLNRKPTLSERENGSKLSKDALIKCLVSSDEFRIRAALNHEVGDWLFELLQGFEIIVPLQVGGLRFLGPVGDASVMRTIMLAKGMWEPHVTQFIIENLSPGDTFVDVGANFGYYTLVGAFLVGDKGRVIAFEPMPYNYGYCKRNISLNGLKNVHLCEFGLWDRETVKNMLLPDRYSGNSQIIVEDRQEGGHSIKCIPLDLLNLEPTLIKMDIEGAEPFALAGMHETLQRHKPVMVLEMNRLALKKGFGLDAEVYWDFFGKMDYELSVLQADGSKIEISSLLELKTSCSPEGLVDLVAIPNRWKEARVIEITDKTFHLIGRFESSSEGNLMHSTEGERGVLVYGPYWALRKGNYQVKFELMVSGKPNQEVAWIDVNITEKKTTKPAANPVEQKIGSTVTAGWKKYAIDFVAERNENSNLLYEFRVFATGMGDVKVKRIFLEKL